MAQQPKRLHRSRTDRILAGVLGGLANHYSLDPSLVRIAYGIIAFFTGFIPGIVLYLAMIFIVPLEPETSGPEAAEPRGQAD